MPYAGPSDPKLPSKVREMDDKKQRQWIAVFNSSYRSAISDGKSTSEAESIAFRNANGVVMKDFSLEELKKALYLMLSIEYKEDEKEEEEVTEYVVNAPAPLDPIALNKVDSRYRIVYGVVLEPGTVDLQGDVISEEEIFKSMHDYMVRAQVVNLQHTPIDVPSVIVENFIAPTDMLMSGEPVKKGSWIMGTKILDDSVWEAVEKGEFTGYSIEGRGIRTKVEE